MIQVTCIACGKNLFEYESSYGDGELYGRCLMCDSDSSSPTHSRPGERDTRVPRSGVLGEDATE